jgi:hypothetical protein
MDQISSIEAIAEVIQLAVAPVFLIAGIAGLLGVLSSRLGRVIDRARVIELRVPQARSDEQRQLLRAEASILWLRIRLTKWAIRLCVSGALMVCLVIVALFVGDLVRFNLSVLIATFFVAAMLFIISGLVCLLREIGISARRTREGMEAVLQGIGPDSTAG